MRIEVIGRNGTWNPLDIATVRTGMISRSLDPTSRRRVFLTSTGRPPLPRHPTPELTWRPSSDEDVTSGTIVNKMPAVPLRAVMCGARIGHGFLHTSACGRSCHYPGQGFSLLPPTHTYRYTPSGGISGQPSCAGPVLSQSKAPPRPAHYLQESPEADPYPRGCDCILGKNDCRRRLLYMAETEERPRFHIILSDRDAWAVEAELSDSTLERIRAFKDYSGAAEWVANQSEAWVRNLQIHKIAADLRRCANALETPGKDEPSDD
jgi:hypothetical protein